MFILVAERPIRLQRIRKDATDHRDTSTICFKTAGLSKQDSYKMRTISIFHFVSAMMYRTSSIFMQVGPQSCLK